MELYCLTNIFFCSIIFSLHWLLTIFLCPTESNRSGHHESSRHDNGTATADPPTANPTPAAADPPTTNPTSAAAAATATTV